MAKVASVVFGVVKAVSGFAMGAASSLFTAGGALATGGVSMSGGWASAVGGLLPGLGGSTLGGILGSAVQYAGLGALTAAVTGGDIGKGALYGAIGGGVMGALGGDGNLLGGGMSPGDGGGKPPAAGGGGTVPGAGAPSGPAVGAGGSGNSWLGPVLKNVGQALIGDADAKDSKPRQIKMPRVWYPSRVSTNTRVEGPANSQDKEMAVAPTAPEPIAPKKGVVGRMQPALA